MKINQKYLEVGIILIILLVGFGAFFLGYQPYVEKTDAVEQESKQLLERINVLESKIARTSEFEEAIENADKIIKEVLAKYGPGVTMEKSIMMVVDMIDKSGISVQSLSMTDPITVFEGGVETSTDEAAPEESIEGEEDEEQTAAVVIKKANLNVTFTSGYTSYKTVTDYINFYAERMTVDNFTLAYNQESGLLDGTMSIALYEVHDKNHTYVAPVFPEDISIGTENIFKSLVVEPAEELQEGEEPAV